MRDIILSLLDKKSYRWEELLKESHAREMTSFKLALSSLEAEGIIIKKGSKYYSCKKLGLMRAVYMSSSKRYGFARPVDVKCEDFFVPPSKNGGAWNGDTVLVSLEDPKFKGDAVRVEKIIKRAVEVVCGNVIKTRRGYELIPDDKHLDLSIKLVDRVEADSKIAVKIISYDMKNGPVGKVIENFGSFRDRNAMARSVLYTNGFRPDFPHEVLSCASSITQTVNEDDIAGRRDLREKIIITIDGDDSKDLDDAISLTTDESGRYVLSVHIADVSHYVTEDSPIDVEAYNRGTSVYYADKVVPMLPVELSNGICSLNEGVDRLTMSVSMTIDKNGNVVEFDIFPSVIRSTQRMTYKNCNLLFNGKDIHLNNIEIKDMLFKMRELAEILYKKRIRRGSIDIETTEAKIVCDKTGKPTDVKPNVRGVSEKLIEEFMLCANETVAEYVCRIEKPSVYRVHSSPEMTKITQFLRLAKQLGYRVNATKELNSRDIQKIVSKFKGTDEEAIIGKVLLRCMSKAKYSHENLGHFGLSSEYYCHFTSPIRRYPDLLVHRYLKMLLLNTLEGNAEVSAWQKVKDGALMSSNREVAADVAEREIEKRYKAEFMQKHMGESFDAIISGVQTFGVFAELKNTVEGKIPIKNLPRDEYSLDSSGFILVGEYKKNMYRLGDPIRVVCVDANRYSGEIEWEIE